uniref:Uncharacterized protein n=1 Tax=Panagrolaimus superbus TaxID=310955 RepID=A0A914YZC2_9BILA
MNQQIQMDEEEEEVEEEECEPLKEFIHSKSDVRNLRITRLRRPFIASPFMPSTVSTQKSTVDRRRTAATTTTTTIPSSSRKIEVFQSSGRSSRGYDALNIKKQPNIEPSAFQEAEEENDIESLSSEESSILRFRDLTGKDWTAIIICILLEQKECFHLEYFLLESLQLLLAF